MAAQPNDVVIVGGGAAGLSAALVLGRDLRRRQLRGGDRHQHRPHRRRHRPRRRAQRPLTARRPRVDLMSLLSNPKLALDGSA